MFSPVPTTPESDPPPRGEPTPVEPFSELADGSPRRLDPRYVPCARIGGGLLAAALFLAGVIGFTFLALGGEVRPARLVFLGLLLAVLIALVALSGWFYPPLKLRHCTWRLSPDGLEIRRGVWFRHVQSVPRARVQHTDVERGPIERRYELATLVVHTAGHQDSEIRLEGLRHATALAIRDHLLGASSGA